MSKEAAYIVGKAIEDMSLPSYLSTAERIAPGFKDVVEQWIRTGAVVGKLAFKAAEVLLRDNRLWHGTPYDIPAAITQDGNTVYELRPSLPRWRDGQGRTYAHGDRPVVCLADKTNFPITRALVSPEGPKSVFAHHRDRWGRYWSVIGKEYYDWACEQQITGIVFGVKKRAEPSYHVPYVDPLLGEIDEYRIAGPVIADLPVRVGMEDLPETTLVVDGPSEVARDFSRLLARHANPVALADELGLGLSVPGGDLPIDMHPFHYK